MQAAKSSSLSSRNLSRKQRLISALAGTYLLYRGIRKRGPVRIATGAYLLYRGAAGHCPLSQLSQNLADTYSKAITIRTSITINKPIAEVYAFWRQLENLPLFMKHLKNVEVIDEDISEWQLSLPGKIASLSWRSEIIEDVHDERIAWRSLPGSSLENEGIVHFLEAGKFGTEVYVLMQYRTPAGIIGNKVGQLLNPLFENMVREDIKNFRRYMENREIPTIEGQPVGGK